MDLPTAHEIEDNPGAAIIRLRNLRCELDGAEVAAISAAVRQGWSLTAVADRFGISRQAVTQRLQRRLNTRRPNAALRKSAEERSWAEARERKERFASMLREQQQINREREALRQRTMAGAECACACTVRRFESSSKFSVPRLNPRSDEP